MTEHSTLALARDLCSRATPHRLLRRVAGIAFNFSSVTVEAEADKTDEKAVAENLRPSGIRPAFRAL